ncbi:MAG: hypothetical protein GY866_08250 [Proteobacteria bacterium]|nr:hypothetical protein [Pseudomonadota bacterium]
MKINSTAIRFFVYCFITMILFGYTPKTSAESKTGNPNDFPDWVNNPVFEDGVATVSCVAKSPDSSFDRLHAAALARIELSYLLETEVGTNNEEIRRASTQIVQVEYTSYMKSTTSRSLRRSKIEKEQVVHMDGVENLCVMLVYPKDKQAP